MGKGGNADYQYFLHFPQKFSKAVYLTVTECEDLCGKAELQIEGVILISDSKFLIIVL